MPPGSSADARFIPLVVMFLVFAGVSFFQYLRQRRWRVAIEAFLDPYRKGDFDAAPQAAGGLRRDARAYCFFRGAVLMHLGDLKEAETLLQQSVQLSEQRERALRTRGIRAKTTLQRQVRLTALSRSALGEFYLDRGRYNEALGCFEAGLRDWPGRGSFHRAIAETWLRRGDSAAEALKRANLAVNLERASKEYTQGVRDTNLGEALVTLAWAVAVAERDPAQVDRLVAEAESKVAGRLVTSCAQVQYFSGRAYEELGDRTRSAERFEKAARIGPRGRWGRAARAAVHA
jgi:tetratricopeptide (TPR) repeat protein